MEENKVKLLAWYIMKNQPEKVDKHLLSHGIWETIGFNTVDGEKIYDVTCIMSFHKDRKTGEKRKVYEWMISRCCEQYELKQLTTLKD